MRREKTGMSVLGAVLAAVSASLSLDACTVGAGIQRGIYEASQQVQRDREDPPHDLPPTYDEYERFRKKPAAPGP